MELGAVVCRTRSPRCDDCPVQAWCADPTVYEPPPRQSTFEGSRRQVRGLIIRELRSGSLTTEDLATTADRPLVDVQAIARDLEKEGLIRRDADRWTL